VVLNMLPNLYTAALTVSNTFNLYVCLSVFVSLRVSSFNIVSVYYFTVFPFVHFPFLSVVFTVAYVFLFSLLSFL